MCWRILTSGIGLGTGKAIVCGRELGASYGTSPRIKPTRRVGLIALLCSGSFLPQLLHRLGFRPLGCFEFGHLC